MVEEFKVRAIDFGAQTHATTFKVHTLSAPLLLDPKLLYYNCTAFPYVVHTDSPRKQGHFVYEPPIDGCNEPRYSHIGGDEHRHDENPPPPSSNRHRQRSTRTDDDAVTLLLPLLPMLPLVCCGVL